MRSACEVDGKDDVREAGAGDGGLALAGAGEGDALPVRGDVVAGVVAEGDDVDAFLQLVGTVGGAEGEGERRFDGHRGGFADRRERTDDELDAVSRGDGHGERGVAGFDARLLDAVAPGAEARELRALAAEDWEDGVDG